MTYQPMHSSVFCQIQKRANDGFSWGAGIGILGARIGVWARLVSVGRKDERKSKENR
jgi:hypothetical protein